MSQTRGALLALAAAVGLSSCAAGSTAGPVTSVRSAPSVRAAATTAFAAQMQTALQQAMDASRQQLGFPGAIAGVWNAQGSWIGITGSAGPGTDRSPAPADHSRIGSLTKTFTGISVLQQVDKGLVSLDDPIEKYVPGMPNGTTATLRMLATMSSGIPAYSAQRAWLRDYYASPTTRTYTPQQLVDLVKGQDPMFPAGTRFFYSNTNTVLLGMVIEKVTGKPLSQVLQEEILRPLGMSQTSYPDQSAAMPTPYLHGVTDARSEDGAIEEATDWNPSWGSAAGAMISQIDDLRIWGEVLGTGGGLISSALQQQRVASLSNALTPGSTSYGLGYASFNGWLGHNGSLPGYTAYVVYHPATQTVIAVMANSNVNPDGKSPADTIGHALERIVVPATG